MAKVHGLSLPSYLYTSQREWVWAQKATLEQAYVKKAETKREKQDAWDKLYNFLVIWGRRGYWDMADEIARALRARRKQEENNQK